MSHPTAETWNVIFSAALTIFAAVQLWFNVQTKRTSKQSADAALISARTAERQQLIYDRPYVSLKQSIFRAERDDIQRSDFFYEVLWGNDGKSWTVRGRNYLNWSAFPQEIGIDFTFPDIDFDESTLTNVTVPPGGTALSPHHRIPWDTVKDAMEGAVFLYFWGWIEYDGIIPKGPRYRTEFCVRLVPTYHTEEGKDGKREAAAFFRIQVRHNGADSDCLNPVRT